MQTFLVVGNFYSAGLVSGISSGKIMKKYCEPLIYEDVRHKM